MNNFIKYLCFSLVCILPACGGDIQNDSSTSALETRSEGTTEVAGFFYHYAQKGAVSDGIETAIFARCKKELVEAAAEAYAQDKTRLYQDEGCYYGAGRVGTYDVITDEEAAKDLTRDEYFRVMTALKGKLELIDQIQSDNEDQLGGGLALAGFVYGLVGCWSTPKNGLSLLGRPLGAAGKPLVCITSMVGIPIVMYAIGHALGSSEEDRYFDGQPHTEAVLNNPAATGHAESMSLEDYRHAVDITQRAIKTAIRGY